MHARTGTVQGLEAEKSKMVSTRAETGRSCVTGVGRVCERLRGIKEKGGEWRTEYVEGEGRGM
jgi:hypothetical protein